MRHPLLQKQRKVLVCTSENREQLDTLKFYWLWLTFQFLKSQLHRGKAKYLTSATRSPLNMFFGFFYPLLFELSALIPDPAFSQGLLDAFINTYLFLFSVLEH